MKRFVNLSFKMIVSLVTVMIIVASWFTWRMLVLQEENFNDGLKSARILLETLKDSETQGPKLLTEINIVQGTDVSVTKLVDSAKSIKNNIPQLIDVKIISAGDKKLLASWDNSNVWPTNILNTLGKIDNKYFHKQVEKDNIGRFFHSPENELLIYYTPLQRVGDSDPQGYMYMEYSLQSLYKASYQSIMILIRSIGVMIIVVIIVLSVLNRLLIVQPVKFVSNEMQAVGSGDLQRHIEHHKNDEIGDMTRSFNTMVHGLQGFTQYVSKDVVQQILETGTSRIAGTSTKVAIFFSDIRSFTSITETYPANDVVNMLNSYFDTMVPIIQESGGNLDKFIGDAIMAEWGGIEASDKDPYQACYAALLQLDALNHFNEKRRKSATFEINIGMGINYGEAIVGTIGSEGKMEFTVIGDAVNLASRLEGLTKEYGVKIIISHSIAEHVQDYFLCRELDKVAVKGKVEGVRIYELVGRKLDVSPDTINNINKYHDALSLYRNKEFDASIKILDSISDFVTNKAAQRLKYIAKEYLISPPSSDWNGISIKTSK